MLKQLKQRRQGFTIIEVLIVLAIAGLIMVVVFMAVPNLRRNQANNAIRTQANNILAAYGEVSSNKGGATLSDGSSTTTTTDAAKVKSAANIADSVVTVTVASSVARTVAVSEYGTDTYAILTGVQCSAQDSADVVTPSSSRKIVIMFAIRTPSTAQVQCLDN